VPHERSLVLWVGRAAVISLPAEIDMTNADLVRDDLLSVLNHRPATLIVDMGGTTFCNSSGVNALIRAHRRATACESEMRLVVTHPAPRRVLSITGLDDLFEIYPSATAALNATAELRSENPAEEQATKPGHASATIGPDGWAVPPGHPLRRPPR
jgi:anti-sigma B factor antagonist